MDSQIPAYNGNESYVFVCYSHKDSDTVLTDLKLLVQEDIRFWYDEGIEAGKSWRGEIASSIKNASKFIYFISANSLHSEHCLREVDYAVNNGIEIVPVYLDDSTLPDELDLVLNRVQALFRTTDPMYERHFISALKGSNEPFPLDRFSGKSRSKIPSFALALVVAVSLLFLLIQQDFFFTANQQQNDFGSSPSPNSFALYLEGVELMERWDQGDNLDGSIERFQESVNLDPDFALGYARLADAHRIKSAISGDSSYLDLAEQYIDDAVRLNPGLSPVQTALGRIHTSRGNHDLAFAALETALTLDPNDADANSAMGAVYENQGRLTEAEVAFEKSVILEPDNTLLLDIFGNFLYRNSRYEEAAEQWRAVLEIAPDHYGSMVNLSAALSYMGRVSEEIEMLQEALAIQPTYMGFSNLGTALGRVERYSEAIEALNQAIEIDSDDWLAWGNLGSVYFTLNGMDQKSQETYQRAIDLAEAARELDSRDAFVHIDLALYYAMLGNSELSNQRLNTALILSPESGEIRLLAGITLEQLGEREKAIEQILSALEFGYPREAVVIAPELVELLEDPRLEGI